jgi:hypothetical protein
VTWFFTSFLRKIAGFISETRASDDYTRFWEGMRGGGKPEADKDSSAVAIDHSEVPDAL